MSVNHSIRVDQGESHSGHRKVATRAYSGPERRGWPSATTGNRLGTKGVEAPGRNPSLCTDCSLINFSLFRYKLFRDRPTLFVENTPEIAFPVLGTTAIHRIQKVCRMFQAIRLPLLSFHFVLLVWVGWLLPGFACQANRQPRLPIANLEIAQRGGAPAAGSWQLRRFPIAIAARLLAIQPQLG